MSIEPASAVDGIGDDRYATRTWCSTAALSTFPVRPTLKLLVCSACFLPTGPKTASLQFVIQ